MRRRRLRPPGGSSMKLLDRILLGICAVVLALFAGLLLATMWGSTFVVNWLLSSNVLLEGGIAVVILVLLAVYLVILVTRFDTKRYIVYPRELGEVKISTECVESLIVEAAGQIAGVEQVKAVFTDVVEPKVALKVLVYPDYNLSQLSEELQESVRAYVEKTVGIVILQIEVSVVGIGKKAKEADIGQDHVD